jgi:class 3 adenylate cyclase
MAFFGYPEAQDDDEERAACAGLPIFDAFAKLNERPGCPRLIAGVGIDSGDGVVGKGRRRFRVDRFCLKCVQRAPGAVPFRRLH